jgi:catalase
VQIMPEADAKDYHVNPFDVSKVWPHADYPLIDVGVLELNENPDNYFQDVEQSAFAPAHIVDGIGFSPDRMLQGRILGYPDAQRYRLGANYEQIPVNRCPFATSNYQRDGAMRVDGNGGRSANYFPNSFDNIKTDESYREPAQNLDSSVADWYDRNGEGDNDHYSQPGKLFREVMDEQAKENAVNNIVSSMSGIEGPQRENIINRQLCHFFRADVELGMRVAKGLGVDVERMMPSMAK